MKENFISDSKFYGNEVSEYGQKNKRVDYATLSKAFDAILWNNVTQFMQSGEYYWELVNGSDYDEDNDCYKEIFQYYVIDNNGYDILSYYTDEIVFYCEELDMYVWCVTHFGTSWDYVLTSIKIKD